MNDCSQGYPHYFQSYPHSHEYLHNGTRRIPEI